MAFYIRFVIAVFYDLHVDQMNIKTVFLYKAINQILFIETLKSYYNNLENMICKFNKALYNLK